MSEDSTSTERDGAVSMGIAGTGSTECRGRRLLETLRTADVLVGDDELTLAGAFHRDWREEMATLRDRTLVAPIERTVPGVDAERTEYRDTPYYALEGETGGVETDRMVSHVVAVADVAAVRAQTAAGVPPETARSAARPLRQFLAACPVCGVDLVTMTDSCCGGHGPTGPTEVLACRRCEVPVYVFEE